MNGALVLRPYDPGDAKALADLFLDTVHQVNAKDYTASQLDAWAPKDRDLVAWQESFDGHVCIVAEMDGEIAGFGDIDTESGCLDRLYVHADCQRRGTGRVLCEALEAHARGPLHVHASSTAVPFFEKMGYKVVRKQAVQRNGQCLTNYLMEKKEGRQGRGGDGM